MVVILSRPKGVNIKPAKSTQLTTWVFHAFVMMSGNFPEATFTNMV